MSARAATIALIALSGCGDGNAANSPRGEANVRTALPAEPFELACDAGEGATPNFARQAFRIRIDPTRGTFAMPGWDKLPIAHLERSKIVLRDETIAPGRGGNQVSSHVSYDLPWKTLSYDYSSSGIVHVNYHFRSTCEVLA